MDEDYSQFWFASDHSTVCFIPSSRFSETAVRKHLDTKRRAVGGSPSIIEGNLLLWDGGFAMAPVEHSLVPTWPLNQGKAPSSRPA